MSDNNPYFINNYTFRPDFCNESSNNVFIPVPPQNFSMPPPPLMPQMPGFNPYHQGNPVRNQGNSTRNQGNPMRNQGKPIGNQGNPINNLNHQEDPSDQDFIKQYERLIPKSPKQNKKKSISITQAKKELRQLLATLDEAKHKHAYLKDNLNTLNGEEWAKSHREILETIDFIENQMSKINDSYLNTMSKALVKRAAKRMRLKRLKGERQTEKRELMKKRHEKSRSIDESLQKIVDDIAKAKEEEQSKLQADVVLKEVLRKKHDAKKYISKLDALLKLRKARLNTAKGRGVAVSESATSKFNEHTEKLSLLWTKKLASYEKEETQLRDKLKSGTNTKEDLSNNEKVVVNNLGAWQEHLFGGAGVLPQRDFGGDLKRFVEVRFDWDQYVNNDGTSLPIGWVTPEYLPTLTYYSEMNVA